MQSTAWDISPPPICRDLYTYIGAPGNNHSHKTVEMFHSHTFGGGGSQPQTHATSSFFTIWQGSRNRQCTVINQKSHSPPLAKCLQLLNIRPFCTHSPNLTLHWLPCQTQPHILSYDRDPFLQPLQPYCMACPTSESMT